MGKYVAVIFIDGMSLSLATTKLVSMSHIMTQVV